MEKTAYSIRAMTIADYDRMIELWKRTPGIGEKLMEHSLAKLREAGIAKCHLFLYSDNETALAFYEKTGWEKRGNLFIYSKEL